MSVDLVTLGLFCDAIGATVLVVPETKARKLFYGVLKVGELERARYQLFELRNDLEDDDPGFEEFRAYLLDNFDREHFETERGNTEDISYFDVNYDNGNVRAHVSPRDRAKIPGHHDINRTLRTRFESLFYRTGVTLLIIGFGLQIVARL